MFRGGVKYVLLDRDWYENLIGNMAELFEKSFGKIINNQYLHWRYLENPINDILVAVSIEDKCVVANYSASPCLICIEDKVYKTGLSMTTMTEPNYRGRGLFPQLANELYNYMTSSDYLMVWGFPNVKSHQIFNKYLWWTDICTIPMMQLSLMNCKKEVSNPYFDNEFNLNYMESKSIESLIHVKKDTQYLRWRYSNNPINSYENFVISHGNNVSSFCVTKFYMDSIDLVDFQVDNLDEGEYLLRQVISFGLNSGCRFINCWAPTHHFMYSLCEKVGFRNSTQNTNFGFNAFNNTDYKYYLEHYENWFIQMGDSDVY